MVKKKEEVMKTTLIEEVLAPLSRVHRLMEDPVEKELLEVAIATVQNSLDELFGDLFDAE